MRVATKTALRGPLRTGGAARVSASRSLVLLLHGIDPPEKVPAPLHARRAPVAELSEYKQEWRTLRDAHKEAMSEFKKKVSLYKKECEN